MSLIISPGTSQIFTTTPRLESYAIDDGAFLPPQSLRIWPFRSTTLGTNDGTDGVSTVVPILSPMREQVWELNPQWPGTQTRKYISGVTRDRQGNPLANCTVVAIRNATNLVDSTTTSDANGNYGIWVKNSDAYYLVGFLAGSPDVEGVTDNNVTGV